jgi:predicted acyltransferase
LLALDLLRGLAVMGMIMVAYAGDWENRFQVLTHADWRGFALADMIFPSFLFCVGAALPYSFRRRAVEGKPALILHVLWRSAALIVLGIVLNLLPGFDFGQVRLPGILQRIGLCYAVVGTICVLLGPALSLPRLALVASAILFGYAALLLAWDAPGCGRACFDSANALPAVVDRAVFGVHHLWPYGTTNGVVTYDPEGLVSTLGALFNVLVGVMTTVLVQRHGLRGALGFLALAGGCCVVIGLSLDPLLPVVKKLWTPSFALLSSGFALLVFVVLAWLSPRAHARWSKPILAFGSNATLAFVGITLIDTLMHLPLAGPHPNAHDSAAALLGRLIPEPRVASAAYSALLLFALGFGLYQLYRRRIFFKL